MNSEGQKNLTTSILKKTFDDRKEQRQPTKGNEPKKKTKTLACAFPCTSKTPITEKKKTDPEGGTKDEFRKTHKKKSGP